MLLIGPTPKPNVNYKNSTAAGPLADVFSKRFNLAKGTSGTKKETEAIGKATEKVPIEIREKYRVKKYL